jgi:hypothetical protein
MQQNPTARSRGFRCSGAGTLLSTVSAGVTQMYTNITMKEQCADIRPVTRALKQISNERLSKGRGHYEGTHHSAALLLEPNCTELPTALLEDTVLQPIDKIVLLIVMKIVRQCSDNAFLPTQVQLARMANVASPDTIWRALLILRCSRWLTACQRMWCKGAAFEPSAYVANAKPLPVADTLFLDPNYIECLKKCTGHAHARVRKVAGDILAQLPEEIRNRRVEHPTLASVKI